MKYTTNYNLKKPEGTDTVNINDLNNNTDILDTNINSLSKQINNLSAYAIASGTNAYTATIAGITALTEGFSIKIKFTNANTEASTLNINGLGAKLILKGNGSEHSSGNIKAGQICNLVYNGLNFQLLGEGGEYGTATSSDVLSGKTIGTDGGLIAGTILSKGAATITPSTVAQIILAGQYLSGIQTIAGDADLIPANIKSGVDIFGVTGTAQIPSGSAFAAQVLAGYTFSNTNSVGLNGSMPNQGNITATLTTQGQQYTVPAGYHAGAGKVTANISNLVAENIKNSVNVGGVVGALVENVDLYSVIPRVGNGTNGNEIRTYGGDTEYKTDTTVNYILFKTNITVAKTISSDNIVLFNAMPVVADTTKVVGTSFNANTGHYMVLIFNPRRANVTIPYNNAAFTICSYLQ